MGRLSEKLCEWFGCKFRYYLLPGSPQKQLRACKRCMKVEEFRRYQPGLLFSGWYRLVRRTKKEQKSG